MLGPSILVDLHRLAIVVMRSEDRHPEQSPRAQGSNALRALEQDPGRAEASEVMEMEDCHTTLSRVRRLGDS